MSAQAVCFKVVLFYSAVFNGAVQQYTADMQQ